MALGNFSVGIRGIKKKSVRKIKALLFIRKI